MRRFLAGLPGKYRVGLVTFSSEPYVAAPLTHDRKLVLEGLLLGDASFGQGTAIGDALARSVELLKPVAAEGEAATPAGSVPPPPDPNRPLSAILLLSDGAQTRGTLAPLQGAARAKSYGIPVYTVALGTPDGVLNRGGFSRPVPPDPATLRQIAQVTGGEFFATQSEARLNAVYEDLASRLGHKTEWRELSFALVGGPRSSRSPPARCRWCGISACREARACSPRRARARGRPCRSGLRRHSSKSVTTVVTVTRTTSAAASPPAPARGESIADVVARVLPGVVNVRTVGFDGSKAEGSGVVVDRRGVIVTNNHVVRNARTLTVSFNDGRHAKAVRATVIGTAAKRDLAIIRVGLGDLVPVPLGRSSRLRLGDGVIAIGFPLDLGGGPTVTQGIVSGLDRTVTRRTARISRGCCRPTPRSTRATPAGRWSIRPAG